MSVLYSTSSLRPHANFDWNAFVDYLLWDDDCSYERLGSVVLGPFAPAGSEVTIRVTDRPVDRSAAKRPIDAREGARPRLKVAGLMVRS